MKLLWRSIPFLVALLMLVVISGCRTIVPEPSMPLSSHKVALPKYSMHNIGPQRVSEARAARFADLDQDGNLDLLVGGRKAVDGFHVEWGDGDGHWRVQQGPVTSMQPRDFAVGDIDGDGSLEVLIGGEGDQKGLQVWHLDEGTQHWKLVSSPILAGLYHAVELQDVNHDGWLDIIAARYDNEQDGGVFVLLNNGRGGWLPGVGPMVSGFFTDISIADVNGDGDVDIVASRRGGLGSHDESDDWRRAGGVQIWYGDGSARWEPEELPLGADAESVTVSDVNGDGHLDIVAGLYQQGIVVWIAGKNGWKRQTVTKKGSWYDLRVGDLDGDGRRELVAASHDGHGMVVWHWKGKRFIEDRTLVPSIGIYFDMDLGDVRNDGQLAIAGVRADGAVEVWSGLKASPEAPTTFKGRKVGKKLSVFFDSGVATLNSESLNSLKLWAEQFKSLAGLKYELEGRADIRPIHSDLYPNNRALSQARAESVLAWLTEQGVPAGAVNIKVVGADDPLPEGKDPLSLKLNRRVFIQAYRVESVRLPKVQKGGEKGDLFHISGNKVFKTIDGIPGYRFGAGDLMAMTFWQGGKKTEYKVTVQVDGTVSLPYQAALQVNGLTPREVDAKVTNILKKFERNPRVDVQLLKARSKTASIFGEIQDLTRQPTGPGTYFLKGRETLVDFLSRVGGPSKDADLTKVQMLRNGKTVILNLNKAIKQGDWNENAILDDGDTIFVPSLKQSQRRVYVLGEVGKPGVVEFIGDIKFLDAISESGGLNKDAYLPDIRVLRASRDVPLIVPVDFKRFMEKGDLSQNVALQDKDVIIIPRRPIANWNQFIADITPTFSLLTQPASIAQEFYSIRVLSQSLK